MSHLVTGEVSAAWAAKIRLPCPDMRRTANADGYVQAQLVVLQNHANYADTGRFETARMELEAHLTENLGYPVPDL